jgi:hypothetical protein
MNEIKTCPFCGKEPEVYKVREHNVTKARCLNTDCPIFYKTVLLENWNKRA